jgi:hypothetical protein
MNKPQLKNAAAFNEADFSRVFNVTINEPGLEKRVMPVIAKNSVDAIRAGLRTITTVGGSISARKA